MLPVTMSSRAELQAAISDKCFYSIEALSREISYHNMAIWLVLGEREISRIALEMTMGGEASVPFMI